MKCWECKKEISSAIRVCYLEYHEESGQSKEKTRDICKECYPKLKFNPCHFVEVKKITGRQIKKEIKSQKKNPYLNPDGSFDLIDKFPNYKKKKLKKPKNK